MPKSKEPVGQDGVTLKLAVCPEPFAPKDALRRLNFNRSIGPHEVGIVGPNQMLGLQPLSNVVDQHHLIPSFSLPTLSSYVLGWQTDGPNGVPGCPQ